MRALRIAAMVVGGVVLLVGVLFGFLQTPPGQRALVGLVSDETLHVSGLSGFFPTDLQVAQVELLDEQGVWLRVEKARLRWSFASLLSGRVRVEMLQAALVDVLRAPLPSKAKPTRGSDGSFTLPVGVDVQALSVDTLHLAAPLAGVDSRWTLHGNGLLSADLHEGHLRLLGDRTDGPSGKLAADTRFDLGKAHRRRRDHGRGGSGRRDGRPAAATRSRRRLDAPCRQGRRCHRQRRAHHLGGRCHCGQRQRAVAARRSGHRGVGSPRCERQGIARCRPGRAYRGGDGRQQDGDLEQLDAHRRPAQSDRHGPLRSRGRSARRHGHGAIRSARPAGAAPGRRELARPHSQRTRRARQPGEAAGRHGGTERRRRRSHGRRARRPPARVRPHHARRQAGRAARRKSHARVAERHDGGGVGDRRCRLVPAQDRDRRGQGDRRTPQPDAVLGAGRAAACGTRPPRTDGAPRWPRPCARLAGNALRCRRPRRAARSRGARGDARRQSRLARRPDLVARRYKGDERRGHLRPVGQRQGPDRQVRPLGRAAAALRPAPGTFRHHDRFLDHRIAPGRFGRRQPHGQRRRRGSASVDRRPLRPRRGRRHHRAELRRPLGERRAECHRSCDHA